MASTAPSLLTIILGGIIVNYLIYSLQVRNWLHQQRVLGDEKRYTSLTTLFADLSDSAGRRFARMSRLLDALSFDDLERIKTRLNDYDEALRDWNEKLNSLYVRLTTLLGSSMSETLEDNIQKEFVAVGQIIETLTRQRLDGKKPGRKDIATVKNRLNELQGALIEFNEMFLRRLREEHTNIYVGRKIPLTESNLRCFSNWQLFKALFYPRVNDPTILCTPLDIGAPNGSDG